MKHLGAFVIAFLSFGLILISQTPSCTTEDLSGKALKLFEKADQPKKKTTTDDRIEFLRNAIDEQDDYVEAYALQSSLLFKKCRGNSRINPFHFLLHEALKLTGDDMQELGLIDDIIP